MIRNIIFDLGGVLIDWNPRYLYRKLFDSEAEIEWFLTNVCHSEWNETLDAGESFSDACNKLTVQYPDYQEAITAYRLRWSEMLGGPIHDSVSVLNQISKNPEYDLFSITNWSAETFPVANEMFSFLSIFKDIVVSGEEKIIKPDEKIYQILLNRQSIRPEESVFIDDNQINVESARKVGMLGIHFISPRQLRLDLKKLNVDI